MRVRFQTLVNGRLDEEHKFYVLHREPCELCDQMLVAMWERMTFGGFRMPWMPRR